MEDETWWDIEVVVTDAEPDKDKRQKPVRSFTVAKGRAEAERRAAELAAFPLTQMDGRVTTVIRPRPAPQT